MFTELHFSTGEFSMASKASGTAASHLADLAVQWSGTIAVGALSLALSGVYWGFTKHEEAVSRLMQEQSRSLEDHTQKFRDLGQELRDVQNNLRSELRDTAAVIKRSTEKLSASILASSNTNATRIDLVHARTDFLMDKAVNGAHTSAVDRCEARELRRKRLSRLSLRTALALPVRVKAELHCRSARPRQGRECVECIRISVKLLWSKRIVVQAV